MALTMYMKVTGKNQGEIKGSCDQGDDKKDKILVYAMDHKVEIPRDVHTGLPTGQRIHHPLTVTKAKDVASSKLFAACCKGEQVDVEIDFYRIKPTGEEELYYKITVNDAVIVEMGENTPTTFLAENKPYHDMENVSFTYSKITWSYTDGNIEYTDDWKA